MLKTIIRGSCVILTLQFLTASSLIGQDARSVRSVGKLELHGVIERELGVGQTDEYTVDVTAGQFVRVVARQIGVDVAVKIIDPLGKTILEADRPNGLFGPEAASFIGGTSGEHRVQVVHGSGAGRYQVELLESREPTETDRSRIEAESLEFQAAREQNAGTQEARLRSIELYARAGSIWRTLPDAYEHGLTLREIGFVYSQLGERQKALDFGADNPN